MNTPMVFFAMKSKQTQCKTQKPKEHHKITHETNNQNSQKKVKAIKKTPHENKLKYSKRLHESENKPKYKYKI